MALWLRSWSVVPWSRVCVVGHKLFWAPCVPAFRLCAGALLAMPAHQFDRCINMNSSSFSCACVRFSFGSHVSPSAP
jgi:hypothetical protein